MEHQQVRHKRLAKAPEAQHCELDAARAWHALPQARIVLWLPTHGGCPINWHYHARAPPAPSAAHSALGVQVPLLSLQPTQWPQPARHPHRGPQAFGLCTPRAAFSLRCRCFAPTPGLHRHPPPAAGRLHHRCRHRTTPAFARHPLQRRRWTTAQHPHTPAAPRCPPRGAGAAWTGTGSPRTGGTARVLRTAPCSSWAGPAGLPTRGQKRMGGGATGG